MYVFVKYRRQLRSFKGKIRIFITSVEKILRRGEHNLVMKISFVSGHIGIIASYLEIR